MLLLDEPFGALDAKVRKELRRWLRKLHDEIHVTSIFVTHDQEEALEVADRVVVMDKGRIEQAGTPQQVYDHPHTPAVHEFIGESIVVPVTIEDGDVRFGGESLGLDPQGLASGAARLFARPHDLTIVPSTRRASPARRGQAHPWHRPGAARRDRARERQARNIGRGRRAALASNPASASSSGCARAISVVSGGELSSGSSDLSSRPSANREEAGMHIPRRDTDTAE